MYKIVLLHHGDSPWIEKISFIDWTDRNLDKRQFEETSAGEKHMDDAGFAFGLNTPTGSSLAYEPAPHLRLHTSHCSRGQGAARNVAKAVANQVAAN